MVDSLFYTSMIYVSSVSFVCLRVFILAMLYFVGIEDNSEPGPRIFEVRIGQLRDAQTSSGRGGRHKGVSGELDASLTTILGRERLDRSRTIYPCYQRIQISGRATYAPEIWILSVTL